MGRYQESFNDDQFQNKRDKKKREKEKKKEEKKSKSAKAQSWEDMIAYVDEDGNITSSPPDPTRKRTVNQEDIQIGVSKAENVDSVSSGRTGKVIFFNESKGYGFIKDIRTQESIFVHMKGLIDKIRENDQVTFETESTPKGLSAVAVKKV